MIDGEERIRDGIARARREALRSRRAGAPALVRWLVAFGWGAVVAIGVLTYCWGD